MKKIVTVTDNDDKVVTLTYNDNNVNHKMAFENLLYELANDMKYKRVTIQRV